MAVVSSRLEVLLQQGALYGITDGAHPLLGGHIWHRLGDEGDLRGRDDLERILLNEGKRSFTLVFLKNAVDAVG